MQILSSVERIEAYESPVVIIEYFIPLKVKSKSSVCNGIGYSLMEG